MLCTAYMYRINFSCNSVQTLQRNPFYGATESKSDLENRYLPSASQTQYVNVYRLYRPLPRLIQSDALDGYIGPTRTFWGTA